MEVMAVPSKELLIFYNQIDEWVDQVYPDKDMPRVSFKKNTLDEFIVRAKRKMSDYARKEYEEYLSTST